MQQILRSKEDKSINFVTPTEDNGKIEARFVQRLESTVIVYLSSMTGCNLSCRFCHLTQMKQLTMTPVTHDGYLQQARDVLELVAAEGKLEGASIVHFNFMARGDALSNPHFINTAYLFSDLAAIAEHYNLEPKFKISTIFPSDLLEKATPAILKTWVRSVCSLPYDVEFYYSLYSLRPEFRKRWIPKSLSPELVGEFFAGMDSGICLHHTLINGENSSLAETNPIKDWLVRHNIKCRLNIVRYNPFDEKSGVEASEGDIRTYCGIMDMCPNIQSVHVVSRVGRDVAASCGTFIA